ncbi:MAG: transporter, partial [Flavobacterium sp.]
MNIQPVIPMGISSEWNVITRVIVPIVSQYNISGMGNHESGLSDIVASAFFLPKNSKNGFTWGAGPVVLLPTGSNDFLTAKKFGVGPTVVALKQMGGWTYGALINQIWSVSGDEKRTDVNQMYVNPFVTFNWKSGAGVTGQLEW